MTTTSVTRRRQRLLLAACLCASVAGAARADTFAYVQTSDSNFGVVDLMTGAYSLCGNSGVLLAGLAQDRAGILYGAAFNGSAFYIVDPANGAVTPVGNASIDFVNLGSTTHGVYALDSGYTLYRVDTATGATTAIGPTGLATDHAAGLSVGGSILYLESDKALYTVNTKTGAATMIGSGPNDIGALMFSRRHVLYGGSATTPPVVYTLDPGSGAQTQLSTVENATGATRGLARVPRGAKGTCPN